MARQQSSKRQSSKQHRMPKQHGAPVELSDTQIERVSGGDQSTPVVKQQPVTIGSGTTGAGAGKVSFEPF